jgi:hypothetical protein
MIGFSSFVGWKYHKGQLHTGIYRGSRHVLFITTSYGLLVLAISIDIGTRAIQDGPLTWRVPVATVAFGLGIWALLVLVKYRAQQPRD